MLIREGAAGLFLLGVVSPFILSEVTCLPRTAMGGSLQEQYKESPKRMGILGRSHVLELFTSEGGATWSIVVTDPEFVSCLIMHGKLWIKPKDTETSN